MVTIYAQHQKREEGNNMGLGKAVSKHLETEVGQHIVRDKLKEDTQIMWHEMKVLQMSKRQRLPKLKENSKLK
jgi:hypothetical protein